jgi:hypothetical protein
MAAGCFTLGLVAGPLGAVAALDMSAPVPWTDSGAKPFVQRDGDAIVAIGLTIPAATAKSPPKKRSEAVMPMDAAGLVRSANLQWHPTGHEPEHVYDLPHFDVHFYAITEKVRSTIVPGAPAGTVLPAKSLLPPGGMLVPGFVPGMGMHDVPTAQPEFHHGTFSVSPIIGYWNGDLAFFEVMFTKAWLLQNQDKSGPFPQPASVRRHGAYPTRYAVRYDKDADAYQVTLTNFRNR